MRNFSESPTRLIPSNLILAQPEVLNKPVKKNIIQQEYFFPLLNPPETMVVHSFQNPGKLSDSVAKLSKIIFGVAIRKDIVLEVIRYQRNKKRQPQKTKGISDISGSNKKPHPQKGQGRAQVGNKRNSIWRGGQKVHGRKVEQNYKIELNRKFRAKGMMIAIAAKFREGNLHVFDNFECMTHRTNDLQKLLTAHGLAENHILMVDDEIDPKFERASKNLPKATAVAHTGANVYDIVKREKLVLTMTALESLQNRLIEQYNHCGKRKAIKSALEQVRLAQKS